MKVTFIGHSTLFVEVGEVSILVDPYFSEKSGPYKRKRRPALFPKDFASIDVLLVTHTHKDHFDKEALRSLDKNVTVLLPQEEQKKVRKLGFHKVIGMKEWKPVEIQNVTIVGVPAKHITRTLGYIIKSEKILYVAGDTLLFDDIAKISNKFEIDVAFLPVNGATVLGKRVVMGPSEAVKATRILNPKCVIPVHCGNVPRYPIIKQTGSPELFKRKAEESHVKAEVVILREGDSLEM